MNLQIADVIRRLRRERDITQEDLADALGTTPQSVSRWENGYVYPDMEMIPKIALYFGVTTDVLFGMNDKARSARLEELRKISRDIAAEDKGRVTERRYQHHLAAYEEFPDETEFAYDICRDILLGKIRPVEESVDELRKLCRKIFETSKKDDERWNALRFMVAFEEEEEMKPWLEKLPPQWCNRDIFLLSRYSYRYDAAKRNGQLRQMMVDGLSQVFDYAGGLWDEEAPAGDGEDEPRDPVRGILGGKKSLEMMDLFRDSSTDEDAWLPKRYYQMLLLARDSLNVGDDEQGYGYLEKAVDLMLLYRLLPENTVLSYNCPLLEGLTWEKKGSGNGELLWMYRVLTLPECPFAKYGGDPRMKKQVERLRVYVEE